MDYTIYISPSCPTCISTLQSLEKMKIDINIMNIYTSDNSLSPSPIIPALYRGQSLIAYGNNIVRYFDN